MAELSEAFREIYGLAKDGMNILDEGLSPTGMAASIVMSKALLDQISDAVKAAKKVLGEKMTLIGEGLNDTRRNPNSTLADFTTDQPRSTSLEDHAEEAPAPA